MFGRGFKNLGDGLIIEQEVDSVHALGEEMFDLVQVRIASFEIFHSFSLS